MVFYLLLIIPHQHHIYLDPIEHGADLVVYSTTKYLAGHGNVMGGVVVDSGNFKWKDNPRYPLFNTPDKAYHDLVYANLGKRGILY